MALIVPALLNGMLMSRLPVPVLRVKVPEALLLKELVPPMLPIALSGCAVKVALLSMVPLIDLR